MSEKMERRLAGGNTCACRVRCGLFDDVELATAYLRDMAGDMPVDDAVAQAWATPRAAATQSGYWRVPPRPRGGSKSTRPIPVVRGPISRKSAIKAWPRAWGWEVAERDEFPEYKNQGGTDYFYSVTPRPRGHGWRIKAALETRDVDIRYETAATELTSDEHGRVTGVLTNGPGGAEAIEARGGVILACGGYENNDEMVQTYLGKPYATPYGSPANTGDGIRMAQRVGAQLANMYQHMPFFGIRVPGQQLGSFSNPQDQDP